MSDGAAEGELQRETALLFAGLSAIDQCGPGTLSACLGLHAPAVPLAVLAWGGAVLSLTDDPAEARAAARVGATDFTVTSLGEALRILKNQLRQSRAVSVAVVGDAAEVAREMVERGVQPQVVWQPAVSADAVGDDAWRALIDRGAVPLNARAMATATAVCGLHLRQHVAVSAVLRREGDEDFLHAAPTGTARAWLQAAPRLFPRDRTRWFWAGDTEERGQ